MSDHFLYVIAFTDDVVKVGRTNSPANRLNVHASDAQRRGAQTITDWVSVGRPAWQAVIDERQLIAFCGERWPTAWGAEYFRGASFDEAVAYADGLREAAEDGCHGERCRKAFVGERPESHLDSSAVAQWLNTSRRWMKTNYQRMPHHHCGPQICFTADEVNEFLAGCSYPVAA